MKILLIDNETKNLNNLKTLLKGNIVKVLKYNKIKNTKDNKFDLIILSGGSNHSANNIYEYENEIKLITKTHTPIIGICLGFQLIAKSFNGDIKKKIIKRKSKILKIKKIKNSNIFKNINNKQIKVYESHRYVLKKAPSCFNVYAKSIDGIEIIKHKIKNIYGLQFHPEVFLDKQFGDEIFFNIINKIKNVKK